MLYLALALLGLALTLGCVLGAMNLRPVRIAPPWSLRLLHGAAGSGGLGVFLLATDTLVRGDPAFRAGAGGLLAAALVLGFAALALWRLAPRAAGSLIALHVVIAMFGLAMLAAYAWAG
jgi:hypothetical protein